MKSWTILRLTDILASVEGGLIFSQFFGVIITLSAIAFQVVSVSSLTIHFFTMKFCLLTNSFIVRRWTTLLFHCSNHCYFSAIVFILLLRAASNWSSKFAKFCMTNKQSHLLIFVQALKFSESIYQLHWYNFPMKYQKHFQLIMLRGQNPNYLSGFGFVKCSLESFADVLKFAGSVVALFRNLQN